MTSRIAMLLAGVALFVAAPAYAGHHEEMKPAATAEKPMDDHMDSHAADMKAGDHAQTDDHAEELDTPPHEEPAPAE